MAMKLAGIANDSRGAVTKKRKFLITLEQLGLFLAIVAPLGITFYAALAVTSGRVSWFYPIASILAASLINLGTTAGYHRMLTHQSFRAHPVVQYVLLILGAVAGMGSPVKWAHDHLHHHSHSDTENDLHSPHTPRFQGRQFEAFRQWADAHMGWMFRYQPVQVSAKAYEVTSTPAAQFVHRTSPFWLLAGLLLPLCFGWNAFVWFGMVRLFLNHHITWSVNSICHMWGKQPFQNTKDKSKNNAIVGILAMGEGWHNNHHFRPTSARHGLLPGQLDLTYALICLLERCKLATHVQRYTQCPDCRTWQSMSAGPRVCCPQCRSLAQSR
jgi:stearoyl-CoA desaturase (delta-9 desaturase)